ncbi:MAG TPA: 2Fe-2S iron-sulfur cluster binding domain-containing protein [Dehalococcoidia bacterium]|nr:2Fe-2S iron-sulfur cluster binding domain-containing protein [Dehalococcoidia bacterium]
MNKRNMPCIMVDIAVTINGSTVSGQSGMTILEVARENGIDIPTLCHRTEFTPIGACRVCVVEVEGSRTLVGSCHTPITEGMVIHTHSPKVLETRRTIVELLLASHSGTCYMCDKANICELRAIAADLDVGFPEFQVRRRYYPIEDDSPYIVRDLTKCILCRRCVWACREVAKKDVFAIGYRGFDSKVVVDSDQPLNKEVCRDCGICIPFCPTGALGKPRKIAEEKEGQLLIVKG